MDRWVKASATLCGVGYLPASGTMASALTVLAVAFAPSALTVLALLFVSAGGFLLAPAAIRVLGDKDPSAFVLDEVFGMALSLAGLPLSGGCIALGFLLFRFFDVVKPLGIRKIDRWDHPSSIMLDDAAAGLYANCILRIAVLFLPAVFR